MLPIVIDIARMRLVLVGDGAEAERRLAWLEEAGAGDLQVYAKAPSQALRRAAGRRLVSRLPTANDLAGARIVFIAQGNSPEACRLARRAREAGALVHVEDDRGLSDLHAPATLRRGDLLITVSTGGKSPGLAAQVKRFLGAVFGVEWQSRLDAIAELRRQWRDSGADAKTVSRRTLEWAHRQGWLPSGAGGAPGAC